MRTGYAPSAALRDDAGFIALVLAAGVLLRLAWLALVHGELVAFMDAAEATRVALNFAQSGVLGDAYFPGQGATAHLMPVHPMIAGAIMAAFGPGSAAADSILLGWSLAQMLAAYLIALALMREIGVERAALRLGIILLSLVPVFAPHETIDFRYWEGAGALALGGLNLILAIRLAQSPRSGREAVGIATLAALTMLVSPQVGLATGLCWAIVIIAHLPWRQVLAFATLAATALAVVLTPWMLRNQHELGSAVWLRSNAGIELALANHPAALSATPPERVFHARLKQIHPSANDRAAAAVAGPGGEAGYSARLGRETATWIRDHPAATLRLWLWHIRNFLMPESWIFYFSGWEGLRTARAGVIGTMQLLGLVALVHGVATRQRGHGLIAVYVAALVVPFGLFQPTARYIYLVYPILAFMAAKLIVQAGRYGSARAPTFGWAR